MVMPLQQADTSSRIVWLRPGRRPVNAASRSNQPLLDAERESDGDDDYRHRMTMNLLAFLVCSVLVVSGLWIADTMAEMQKNQDCVLLGRSGCTPVEVARSARW